MSDNVRFMYDFPCTRIAGSPDDAHQTAMSLPEIAELWWRINGVTMSTDISWTDASSGFFSISSGTLVSVGSATRELDLVNPANNPGFFIGYTGSIPPDNNFISYLSNAGSDAIILNGGLFYPNVSLTFRVNASSTANSSIQISTSSTPDTLFPPLVNTGSLAMNFFGKSYTVYLYAQSAATITGSVLDITANSYWPHAQFSDGLPIYNTSTGSVLSGRSPLN